MTFCATDVVTPMFPPAKVVVFLAPGVAAQTRFGRFFRGPVFERDNLRRISCLHVLSTRSVTCFTAGDLFFPTAYRFKPRVGRV